MARRHYKLTAATVQGAKATGKQYRISDGSFGLMLNISRGGTKSWVQRIVICGVRRDLGIGSCHFVSLKDARFTAFENAKIARTGGDPRANEKRKACTFLEAQEKCLAEKERRWKPGTRTGKYWRSTMATYVLPKNRIAFLWRKSRRRVFGTSSYRLRRQAKLVTRQGNRLADFKRARLGAIRRLASGWQSCRRGFEIAAEAENGNQPSQGGALLGSRGCARQGRCDSMP